MRIILLLFCCLFTNAIILKAQDGEQIFRSTCSACHSIGEGRLVGPDLKGVHKREKEKWLLQFIRSSQTMVAKKDPRAVQLFEEFNQIQMPDQELSDAEIKSVLAYIKMKSGDVETVAVTTVEGRDRSPMASVNSTDPGAAGNKVSAIKESKPAVETTTLKDQTTIQQDNKSKSGEFALETLDYMMIGMALFFTLIIWYLGQVIVQLSKVVGEKSVNK